jgi:DNA/RNA endonuclease YhcR with UshA esterase domain
VIPWQEAGRYAGQTITVEGEIVDSYNSGKVAFLNFSRNRDDFKLVVFADAFGRFSEPPEQFYLGKQVRATGEVKLYQGKPEIEIAGPSQIQIVGERVQAVPSPTATLPPTGIVPWQDAGQYVGQRVTVEGDVVRSYNSGKVAFLNFAQNDQGTFSVVVFASDFARWPQTPDQFYLRQTIRATGKIKEYKGAPEMIVESPEQIEVVGPAEFAAASLPAVQGAAARATAAPAPVVPEVISWEDAALYEGQQVTVEGTVVDTYKSAKVIFLNFSPNREAFKVVIFAGDWQLWPQQPDVLYRGKTLQVTGAVQLYKGAPEIIVNRPEQVSVATPVP